MSELNCSAFNWRQLWRNVSLGCEVVLWYAGDLFCLHSDIFLSVRYLYMYVYVCFSREWLVCFLDTPTGALLIRHTPHDVPFVLTMTAIQTLYIILFELFYFFPDS